MSSFRGTRPHPRLVHSSRSAYNGGKSLPHRHAPHVPRAWVLLWVKFMKEKSASPRRTKRLARYWKYIILCTLLCAVFLPAHIARIEEKYIPKHLVPAPSAAYLIARNNRLYRWDAAAQKQRYQVNLKPDSEFFYDGNVLYYSRGRSIFGFDLEGRTSTPLFTADPPYRGLTLLGLTREYFVVSLHSSSGGPTGMVVDRAKHTTMAIDLPPLACPCATRPQAAPTSFCRTDHPWRLSTCAAAGSFGQNCMQALPVGPFWATWGAL